MFKLVVLSAIVAVATARPGLLSSPLYSALVGEKTIESHGNSVVHSAVPVVHSYEAAPVVLAHEPLIAEKTVSSHGHSIVHESAPVIHIYEAAPVVLAHEPLIVAKSVSSHDHSIVHESPVLAHTVHIDESHW
ncbi:uncharacterized protein LOC107045072 [Diachasma alloeum]|uniref:uncharacterized protein LOC107045072 n=1 Tax=Diachasma alloeum TaxID=454923 RepID=UPI0007381145|nr:uncharacterized protein LOC107045072 [Diachasma alloeum]